MKYLIFLLMSCTSIYAISDLEKAPKPYSEIDVLPPYNHGFFVNQQPLKDFFESKKIKIVIELGSWLGASTIYMANLLPEDGLIYAIDHWKGSIEHNTPDRKDVYHLLPTLYEQFLSNIIYANLTDKVIPIKMTTNEASQILNVSADLIYIDASHDEESVYQDLSNWYPKLAKNGIMCGDDPTHPGVSNAIKRFAKENNLTLHIMNAINTVFNFWFYDPKN